MQKCKQVSHDNDDGLGVGGDDMFEPSCPFCLSLNFCGKQAMKGRWSPTVRTHSIQQHSLLTGMFQELAGALCGKERFLQCSEVELQHSSNWIQVICTLRQGILSYEGNIQLSNKYGGGWSWLTNTHSATSFKCISKVIDLHLRTWHPKYPFVVKTW